MNRIVRRRSVGSVAPALVAASILCSSVAGAQFRQEPGRSIGTITTQGNLIVMTLNEGVLGKENLFDLAHRTLRFTPDGIAVPRGERLPCSGIPEFGSEMSGSQAMLAGLRVSFLRQELELASPWA